MDNIIRCYLKMLFIFDVILQQALPWSKTKEELVVFTQCISYQKGLGLKDDLCVRPFSL